MKIIIIGAGPGGYETAIEAAGRGIEVILIEKGDVGGTCLNEGCIPTKVLCRSAEVLEETKSAYEFGVCIPAAGQLCGDIRVDFAKVRQRKADVVRQLRSGVQTLLDNKLITLVYGRAELKDAHTVTVYGAGAGDYSADYIIVATGSSAAPLMVPGGDLPGLLTSRELLDIDHIPESLCIVGAGVIGLEFASVFNSFGTKVTVVEYCPQILPRFDSDLAKRLKQSLSKRGIDIITSAAVQSVSLQHSQEDGAAEGDGINRIVILIILLIGGIGGGGDLLGIDVRVNLFLGDHIVVSRRAFQIGVLHLDALITGVGGSKFKACRAGVDGDLVAADHTAGGVNIGNGGGNLAVVSLIGGGEDHLDRTRLNDQRTDL